MSTNRSLFFKISMLALSLAVMLSGFAAVQPAAAANDEPVCTQYHTVQRGEYLAKIGLMYDVDWRWLAEINDLENPRLIYTGQVLCVAMSDGSGSPGIPNTGSNPVFSVTSVKKDQSVTVKVSGYPANKNFNILMGKIGTQAVNGVLVGTGKTNSNGAFSVSVDIPKKLQGQSTIAIRVEAADGSGYYAYNWFYNKTQSSDSSGSGSGSSYTSGLAVTSVVEDKSVSFKAGNLQPNKTYSVYLDRKNSNDKVTGQWIAYVTTDANGFVSTTVQIPDSYKDRRELSLRLVSSDGKTFVATSWFLNATSTGGTGSGTVAGAIPTFSILAVVRDDSVTIQTYNFPANKQFSVLMGKMGTQGINGIQVDKIKSDKDGSFKATFSIPEKLQGRSQIALRLEATDGSGYYAYNWFYNSTTP
jgi:LysM repeat protein